MYEPPLHMCENDLLERDDWEEERISFAWGLCGFHYMCEKEEEEILNKERRIGVFWVRIFGFIFA